MPWKRGTEPNRTTGKVSPFRAGLCIQSLSLVDAADPKKGYRIQALAASDKINTGRIRIRAEAWRFRKQGAPILYEHGRDPRIGSSPIGRWNNFKVQAGVGLLLEGKIDHFEHPDPRATVVEDIQAGRLTDVSVGHAPARMEIAKEQGGAFLDIQETELGECSIVSVGMDADATFELMAASAYGYEWQEDGGQPHPEGHMDRKILIQLLNMGGASLKEDANDAEVLAAVQRVTQNASLGSRAAEILTSVGLDTQASLDTVKQRIAEIRNPAGFVPKADFDALKIQVAKSTVDTLIAEHKNIPEGQKEFARTLLTQGTDPTKADDPGRKIFQTWYASLPAINTQNLSGRSAGTPPAGGGSGDDMHYTELDAQWCQNLAYFRDERDERTGKVTMRGVERMAQVAEMSSAEAMSIMFGQPVQETAFDRAIREQAQAQ